MTTAQNTGGTTETGVEAVDERRIAPLAAMDGAPGGTGEAGTGDPPGAPSGTGAPSPVEVITGSAPSSVGRSASGGRPVRPATSGDPEKLLGTHIGKYLVVRRISQGGMGVVYEGVHESIGQRVAIKILHPQHAKTPAQVTRFFNEARAVNIAQHPGLVRTMDFGQLDDGTAYLVMEYLDGVSLRARMRQHSGRLVLGDALRLTRQMASALAAAHSKGIVHRDLKPGNVFIVADPESPGGERTKVFDFGVAKIRAASADNIGDEEGEPLTGSDIILGTPTYMAPEQCRGARNVDDRADVYSLGAMLYEMLAGMPPFNSNSNVELLAMHLLDTPRPLHELAPAVPRDVEELVHAMLAKAREERPAMAQVAHALESLEALAARGPGGERQTQLLTMPEAMAGPGAAPATPTPTPLRSTTGATLDRAHGEVAGSASAQIQIQSSGWESAKGAPTVPIQGLGPGPIQGLGPGPIQGLGPGPIQGLGPGPMPGPMPGIDPAPRGALPLPPSHQTPVVSTGLSLRRLAIAVGVSAFLLCGGGLWWLSAARQDAVPITGSAIQPASRLSADGTERGPASPAAAPVRCSLRSAPAGAVVSDAAGVLGTTPLTVPLSPPRSLRLRLPGHAEAQVQLAQGCPEPVNLVAAPDEPGARPAGASAGANRRGARRGAVKRVEAPNHTSPAVADPPRAVTPVTPVAGHEKPKIPVDIPIVH